MKAAVISALIGVATLASTVEQTTSAATTNTWSQPTTTATAPMVSVSVPAKPYENATRIDLADF